MVFVPSRISTTMSLDPEAAHRKIAALCAKHHGNLTYVASELGVARWTVARWVHRFIAQGMADPRGDYGPDGASVVKQRRAGGRKKPATIGDMKKAAAKKAGAKAAAESPKTCRPRKSDA